MGGNLRRDRRQKFAKGEGARELDAEDHVQRGENRLDDLADGPKLAPCGRALGDVPGCRPDVRGDDLRAIVRAPVLLPGLPALAQIGDVITGVGHPGPGTTPIGPVGPIRSPWARLADPNTLVRPAAVGSGAHE